MPIEPRALPCLLSLLAAVNAQTFQVASQPLAVPVNLGKLGLGDFDGDGRPDLVHLGITQTFLLAGGPGGIFAAPAPLPPTFNGSAVKLVDTNADGRLDILRCDAVGCLRVESTAAGPAVTANLGPGRSLAVADFDEDGHVDVVIGGSTTLAFARGDGQGGFLPAATFAVLPVFAFTQLECADLNGDGHRDVVATVFSAPVSVFFGDGAGHFTMQSTSLPGGSWTCLADVDADGDLDLVTGVTAAIPNALLSRNNGVGQFSAPQPIAGLTTRENLAADFDGDGIVDLVGIGLAGMQLALGLGGGQFAAPITFPMTYPYGLVAGDIDGDGRIEALTLSNTDTLMVLHLAGPVPPGLSTFGQGTPACAGTIGIRGTHEPVLGAPSFRVQCTNVPAASTGLLAIGTAVPGGWQPFGLGLQFHLGVAWPLAAMTSDAGGAASVPLRLPGSPIFSGLSVHLQSFWLADPSLGDTCSVAAFDLASSRGLTLTLH